MAEPRSTDNRLLDRRRDSHGVAVSWQVTGVRQDAWAAANPLIVEEDKPDDERDMFLHPEVHGEPETRHVFAAMRKAGQAPHEYPDDTDDRQE